MIRFSDNGRLSTLAHVEEQSRGQEGSTRLGGLRSSGISWKCLERDSIVAAAEGVYAILHAVNPPSADVRIMRCWNLVSLLHKLRE